MDADFLFSVEVIGKSSFTVNNKAFSKNYVFKMNIVNYFAKV